MKKRTLRRIIWLVLIAILVAVIAYAWPRAPIITAFAAKGMCSSVFLADKDPDRVMAEDLSFFPISLAKCKINYEQKSVTSTVFGLAKRTAVYRDGLGAVIVLDTPVEELAKASFKKPDPGYAQDTIPWPLGDVLSDSLPAGVDYERLHAVLDTCFDRPGDDAFKKTLGIAIVYDGQLIAEKYLEGYDAYTKFIGWSMTKSIAGTMVGFLVDDEVISLDEPAGMKEWEGDKRNDITVRNVVTMNSGLDWVENYFTISEVTIMLMQKEDMLAYVTTCDLAHEPGTFWNYSGGDINLMSGIVRRVMNDDHAYHSLLYKRLFNRIGMLNTEVETDADGLFVASSYCYGTTRDWARFGVLFLNNGVFAGDTVLSEDWVEFMKTEAPNSKGKYAGTFWLKEPSDENALVDVPDDIFFADGFQGQRVYIIPSKKLVAVRMGYSMSNFSMNDFLREVIETLPE